MKVHLLASVDHYAEHIRAIWQHLPEQLRGVEVLGPQARQSKRWADDDVVMVAGFTDIWRATDHRVVFVEHGAGQSYRGIKSDVARHYHGGEHPEHVIAYLGPRASVVDSWRRPGFACGAPVCDPYELHGTGRTVAITFHWNGVRVCAEAGTAFEHYVDRLGDIVARLEENDWTVLGHRHPRFTHMSSVWRNLGVKEVDVDTVRREADVLIADNTSLMYEMMYLWRTVVALNAPWYRRDVEHGLRFWADAPARQVDNPDHLLSLIDAGFPDPLGEMSNRDLATVERVYGRSMSCGLDGMRAATWLTGFLGSI